MIRCQDRGGKEGDFLTMVVLFSLSLTVCTSLPCASFLMTMALGNFFSPSLPLPIVALPVLSLSLSSGPKITTPAAHEHREVTKTVTETEREERIEEHSFTHTCTHQQLGHEKNEKNERRKEKDDVANSCSNIRQEGEEKKKKDRSIMRMVRLSQPRDIRAAFTFCHFPSLSLCLLGSSVSLLIFERTALSPSPSPSIFLSCFPQSLIHAAWSLVLILDQCHYVLFRRRSIALPVLPLVFRLTDTHTLMSGQYSAMEVTSGLHFRPPPAHLSLPRSFSLCPDLSRRSQHTDSSNNGQIRESETGAKLSQSRRLHLRPVQGILSTRQLRSPVLLSFLLPSDSL